MTRVNVVPVQELSDQWLIAEYRELPRCLKGNISIKDAPDYYVLGKGHMKWVRKHGIYANRRMFELIKEMLFRGFNVTYRDGLTNYITTLMLDYKPSATDIQINRKRLKDRYNKNSKFYKWTNRQKPIYL